MIGSTSSITDAFLAFAVRALRVVPTAGFLKDEAEGMLCMRLYKAR